MRLEHETDYEAEADMLLKARRLFRDEDGIVVPQVHPELSTRRLLTMERLRGVHLEEFLAGNPSAEQRNEFGRKILRSWYRMLFAGRMNYADQHPGNYLFMEDGRLGVIDFGFILDVDDEMWEWLRKTDRAMTTGRRDDRIAAVKEWSGSKGLFLSRPADQSQEAFDADFGGGPAVLSRGLRFVLFLLLPVVLRAALRANVRVPVFEGTIMILREHWELLPAHGTHRHQDQRGVGRPATRRIHEIDRFLQSHVRSPAIP